MDKKTIKDHLTKRFLSEEVTPGISMANKIKKDNATVNNKGVKDEAKDSIAYNKSLKQDKETSKMAPNKYNYDDKFEKTYHDEMEILNGQEMLQYDSKPDSRFLKRAEEAIEGSSNMGNNSEWANVFEKQQGFQGPEFGKNLIKRIKASTKKRSEETPTINLRGRDIQADLKDTGHKPYAIEENIFNTAQMGGVTSSKGTAGYINNTSKMDKDYHDSVRKPAKPTTDDKKTVKENDSFSEYSNDALADMIVNLSRYENNKEEIARAKQELARRKSVKKDVMGENEEIEENQSKVAVKADKKVQQDKTKDFNDGEGYEKIGRELEYGINNNNNNPQIKESMKRLKFKSEFNGVGNALKLIPEGYKVDNKVFEMTDGNENYRIRWEGNLSEGKAVVLTASDKKMVSEDIKRMKELFGYKSQETLGLVKGNARINENKVFTDIWNKSKQLLGEGEGIESADAAEGDLDAAVPQAAEAKKHVEGSVSTDKGTQAPKPKQVDLDKVVSQASDAKKHVEGSVSTDKGTQAPKPKEGRWEDNIKGQAAEAKKHIHLKESEMEDDEEAVTEETTEDEALMKEIENDLMKTNVMEEEGEEEGEEEDGWNKLEDNDDSSEEKEPSAADIKKTGIPIGDEGDDDDEEIVAPTTARSDVRLLHSPSIGEYWIDNNGKKSKVPDMYLNIASDKSKTGSQKAAIILKKMEADAEMSPEMDDELEM